MGTNHSNLHCEHFSVRFQSCLGLHESKLRYETDTDKPIDTDCSNLCNKRSLKDSVLSQQTFMRNTSSKEAFSVTTSSMKGDESSNTFQRSDASQVPLNSLETSLASTNSLPSLPSSTDSEICTSTCYNLQSVGSTRSTDIAQCINIDKANEDKNIKHHNLLCDQHTSSGDVSKTALLFASYTSDPKIVVNDQSSTGRYASDLNYGHHDDLPFAPRETLYTSNNHAQGLNNRADCVEDMEKVASVIQKEVDNLSSADAVRIERNNEDASHFRDLVSSETTNLNLLIDTWSKVLEESTASTEVCDDIRSVIGQSKLVIAERFKQFSKLIDRAEGKNDSNEDNRPVLLSDLQGFWDMIYFQVEDVNIKYASLDKLRAVGWNKEKFVSDKVIATKQRPPKKFVKKNKIGEGAKKHREAARKRLAEARKALAERNQMQQKNQVFPSSCISTQDQATSNIISLNDVVSLKGENINRAEAVLVKPESIIDALSCAVSVGPANCDQATLSTVSSVSLVR